MRDLETIDTLRREAAMWCERRANNLEQSALEMRRYQDGLLRCADRELPRKICLAVASLENIGANLNIAEAVSLAAEIAEMLGKEEGKS